MIRPRIFAVALLAAALAAGCSFDRRSSQFRCDEGQSCGDGRVCEAGWCVEPVGGQQDGGGGGGDAGIDAPFVCPAECTSCIDDLCVINCTTAGACPELVVCPAGVRCKVECGDSACGAGIDCSAAQSCRIECPANQACAGPITCSPGFCRIECDGADSCTGGLDCSSSCACDTFCTGTGSCTTPPTCPNPDRCVNGIDCTSVMGQCNSC